MRRVLERFTLTGRVAYPKKKCINKTTINEGMVFNVLTNGYENPHVLSQRQISNNFNISLSSVQRVLKKDKLHPYHMIITQ